MRAGNLLSTVLFRDNRLMDVLPLAGKFILRAERDKGRDVLFDKTDESAKVVINRSDDSFILQVTNNALMNERLCRFMNPVMKTLLGELIYSDEGTFVVFNHNAPGVVDIIGSQRELALQAQDCLTTELSKEAMKLTQFSNAAMPEGSGNIRLQ